MAEDGDTRKDLRQPTNLPTCRLTYLPRIILSVVWVLGMFVVCTILN